MNIADFTEEQRVALLDLLVLAMYMDGKLASAEETRVQQLLVAMGLSSVYDRNRQFDASVTRVRPYAQSAGAARECITGLAGNFTTPEQQRIVHDILHDLVASDGEVCAEEKRFLHYIGEAFGFY